MPGVTYALSDFVTGGALTDLPVMKGATWDAQLNRPDSLSCKVDLNDPDVRALDLRSTSEPNKTVLSARTDDGFVLAWGLIGDDGRDFDDDSRTLTLTAQGVNGEFFDRIPVMPAAALTGALTVKGLDGYDIPNPAFDTTVSNVSHGTIGKRLVQQYLGWPGAPAAPFILPGDEPGFRTQTYTFASMKSLRSALDDLVKQEGGPDFAFDAAITPSGLGLSYIMRHGSEAVPRLGTDVGVWSLGGQESPISGLKYNEAVAGGVSLGLMTAGKSSAAVLISRVSNPAPLANGYPPMAVVDTSRSDVALQATLDAYNRVNVAEGERPILDATFTVRGDASPRLGQYRPGDRVVLDPPSDHPWFTAPISIRIMSMSGDESGKDATIGCVILDG